MNRNIFNNNLPYSSLSFEKKKVVFDRRNFNKLFLLDEKKNHIRQFYHIPPLNDIGLFKRYLFPLLTSCKYNNSICAKKHIDYRIKNHYKN